MGKDINNKLLSIQISKNREIEIGKELKITVRISRNIGNFSDFKILFNQEGEQPSIIKQMIKVKEEGNFEEYCTEVRFNKLGNYFFFFLLKIDGEQKAIKTERKNMKQPILLNPEEEAPYWKILVTNEFFTPEWAKDAIFYQLFLDRFCKDESKKKEKNPRRNYLPWDVPVKWQRAEDGEFNNNDFRGGNIRGVIKKLPYLDNLGVKVIYLSPINKSKDRYDGYATIDHMQIDEDFGDFEDLKELHEKAKKFGMHLILDVAFNHCSIDNPIFKEAQSNPNSKYRDWFYFDENGNYKYWYDFKDMALFNQYNSGYQEYVYGENGVIDKFSDYVDGFRLDLAELLQPFFLEGIKKRANLNSLHLIIAEAWDRMPIENLGKGIDCTTNYPISDPILKYVKYGYHEYLKDEIYKNEENPIATIDTSLTSLGTHDTPRALTMLSDRYYAEGFRKLWEIDKEWSAWHFYDNYGNVKFDTDGFRKFEYANNNLTDEEYKNAKAKLKVAAILQYFLPGNPCVFYGDEVGVTGYKDPFSRPPYPYGKEDLELLEFYQKLGAFRNLYKGAGSTIEVLEHDDDVFSLKRVNEKNTVFVAINRGNQTRYIRVPDDLKEGTRIFKLNGDTNYLLPNGGIVILK